MTEAEILKVLINVGVFNQETNTVELEALYALSQKTSLICAQMAKKFLELILPGDVRKHSRRVEATCDTVMAFQDYGESHFAQGVASHLQHQHGPIISSAYAEYCMLRQTSVRQQYHKYITGKRVLLVCGLLQKPTYMCQLIERVNDLGGIIVGLGALWNQDEVTAQDLDLDDSVVFFSLINKKLE